MPQPDHSRSPTRPTTPQAGDVRIGPLLRLAGVLRDLGHDPAAVCAACGLESTVFDDTERRVPFHAAADLIRGGA